MFRCHQKVVKMPSTDKLIIGSEILVYLQTKYFSSFINKFAFLKHS